MNVEATNCECCNEATFHIPLDADCVTFDSEEGFVIHLNEDEMTSLYFGLKEFKCGLKEVSHA